MCSKLVFYYNRNDPNFTAKEEIIQTTPYIGHWFFTAPLYDNNNKTIGNESVNSYVQEDSDGKYLVRHFITYYIDDKPNAYYPFGITAKSRITSGTGDYVNANGYIKSTTKADGRRDIVISYKS